LAKNNVQSQWQPQKTLNALRCGCQRTNWIGFLGNKAGYPLVSVDPPQKRYSLHFGRKLQFSLLCLIFTRKIQQPHS